MELRPLQCDDIPAAMELSIEAGWNQTAEDWRMLIEWDREACFAIEIAGSLAATATLACYGTRLGWIGMVLTRQRFRRRGCARVLMEQTVGLADARGIETLKLDATQMGAPLYAGFGFREEQPVERWSGETRPCAQRSAGAACERIDLAAFGVDRSLLLGSLANRGSVTASDAAFVFTRPGRVARYLGPCVACDRASAVHVITAALREGGAWYWDLLPGNTAALEIASESGFTPVRRLTRMFRGRELRGRDDMIFAIGGFEIG